MGPKMDMKEIEHNKGATADLLQQKPHVEVADSKTPAVSLDEARLAAGISMTGLHTKKLSGAQVIRERKMKEGTWKAENPQRKTPLCQVKGTVGCSGSVKRPHLDSSTPSLDKQQPKKPRNTQVQTGIYKEAVTGIKMAIIHKHHPDAKIGSNPDRYNSDRTSDCSGYKPLGEDLSTISTLQIGTGSILDDLCK